MAACVAGIVVAPLAAAIDTGQTRLFKYLMGTSMRVEVYGGDQATRQQAADESFAAIAEVDRVMSDYRAYSEVSLLNRNAPDGAVEVSQPMLAVLTAAHQLTGQSGGAYSIFTRPDVQLRELVIDVAARTVRFTRPAVRVSLDGVAKGFAAELAAASLTRRGLSGAVDTSGTQYLVGLPPGKRAWSLGIGDPLRPAALLGAIDVEGGGVSTVSIASHPLDPRTGQPATTCLSATVVSPDGTLSDALSRALFVLGSKGGLALLDRFPGTWGVVANRTSRGTAEIQVSTGHERAFHPAR
jgi:thiamine biosynthesis lipoprotein